MDNKLQTLGLAYRAHKVLLGESVLDNIKKIKLLIIASDISANSRERYLKKCDYYNIKYIENYDTHSISQSLGKENVKIVGIIDEGFVKSLLK